MEIRKKLGAVPDRHHQIEDIWNCVKQIIYIFT